MNMILGVNDNPMMKSYAYTAYIHAILENEIWFIGKVKNAPNIKWTFQQEGVSVLFNNDILCIYGNNTGYGRNKNESFSYAPYDKENGLLCEINQIVNIRENANVTFFLGSLSNGQNIRDAMDHGFMVMVTKFGMEVCLSGECTKLEKTPYNELVDNWHHPLCIKMKENGGFIKVYLSMDGAEWELVYETKEAICKDEMVMGVYTYELGIGENYYNWLFTNYIEWNFNPKKKEELSLYYYTVPYIGQLSEQIAPPLFMRTSKDFLEEVRYLFNSLNEYLHFYLAKGYYVVVCLDQYYVSGDQNYKRFHNYRPILVYGFDDEEEKYFILDYDHKLFRTTISYQSMDHEGIYQQGHSIIRYQYVADVEIPKYEFHIEIVKNEIQSFLQGETDFQRYSYMGVPLEGIYGLEIFRRFQDDETARNLFFKDKRISYHLYEYFLLMRERLKYLMEYSDLDKERLLALSERCDRIIEKTKIVVNTIVWMKKYSEKTMNHGIMEQREKKIMRLVGDIEEEVKVFFLEFLKL